MIVLFDNLLGMQTDDSNMVQASLEEALEGILETIDCNHQSHEPKKKDKRKFL